MITYFCDINQRNGPLEGIDSYVFTALDTISW